MRNDTLPANIFSASQPAKIYHIPERYLSDYFLLSCYLLLFLFGAPVNLIAFAKLRKNQNDERKRSANIRPRMKKSGLHDLRPHLNFSDMLIVFVFTTAKICWSITFSWQGGEKMCKLIKFLESTIFQLSSNLIVCIALDRLLLIVLRRRKNLHYAIINVFCYLAWFSAPVLHFWQLFFWTTMTPQPKDRPTWQQCVTIWHARQVELSATNSSIHAEPFLSSNTYTLISIAAISFVPLFIIITSYLTTAVVLHRMELAPSRALLPQVVVTGEVGSLASSSEDRNSSNMKPLERSTPKAWPKIKKYDATPDSNSLSAMGTSQQTIVVLSNGIQSIRRKTIRTNLVLLCSYFLCWLPYNISSLLPIFYPNSNNNVSEAAKFACAFIVLNAILNPFLYSIVNVGICLHGHEKRNSQFRRSHKVQRHCPGDKL